MPTLTFRLLLLATACLFTATGALAQATLPFKVYTGTVGSYTITRGINTTKINEGFLVTGTVPVSPTNSYRIKPGQALALLFQARSVGKGGNNWHPGVPVNGFEKVIRKVDGQEVEMKNYDGVHIKFEQTILQQTDTEYTISRLYKSRFNPPLPGAEFDRTHGVFIIESGDAVAASRESAFARDVNKVAGKVLTAHYLAGRLDAQAFITVEVDFTDVPIASPTGGKKRTGASDSNATLQAQATQHERSNDQTQARDDRAAAKEQREADRAQEKSIRAAARAEAAAERARKRLDAATLRNHDR